MPLTTQAGVDSAGELIVSSGGNSHVRVNGNLIAQPGASILPHGKAPHADAVMVGSSSHTRINGTGVCRAGDNASCDHVASGSFHVSSA